MERNVYRVDKKGSIKNLKLVSENLSEPSENEVRIKVKAIGLNFADIFAILGLYSATPKGSFIPGLEFSGEVEKLGSKVQGFRVGDKVIGVTRFGAYSNYLNVDQRYIIPLPENWSYEEGASFVVQALTAYYALFELGNLKNGQTVLIHSAAGGVGIYANRIAKKFGANTIGTIGTPNKQKILDEEGYDHCILRSKNFRQDLFSTLNGKPLHLVLECIGGKIFEESYRALSPMGRIVVYGSAQFMPKSHKVIPWKIAWKYLQRPKIDPIKMISANKSVLGFNLIWLWDKIDELTNLLDQLRALDLAPPRIDKIFPFSELFGAIEYFKSGNSVGKVVIKI